MTRWIAILVPVTLLAAFAVALLVLSSNPDWFRDRWQPLDSHSKQLRSLYELQEKRIELYHLQQQLRANH